MSTNETKILLVEDDFITAMPQKQELVHKGYNVQHVTTGEEAEKTILENSEETDLILMDIDLGSGIDGTQAAELILKARDLPIVFLSSHTEPEIVEKTEKITSYGYVVKNTGIVVLDASIKMALKLYESKMVEKEKESKIRKSEAKLQGILNNMQDAFFQADTNGIFTFVNEKAACIYGYDSSAEMIGLPASNLYANEQDRNNLIESLKKSGTITDWVGKGRRKDNSEIWVSMNVQILRDSEGNYIGTQGVARNISERKIIEEKILHNEKRLRLLFDNLPIAIYSTDEFHKKVDSVNKYFTEIFGYTLTDIPTIDKWMEKAYPENNYRQEIITETFSRIEKAVENNEPVITMESTVTCNNGSSKRILWKQIQIDNIAYGFGVDISGL